ncbi:TraB/GumN family protein [Sphingopyxis panaciterrae]
MKTWFKKSWLKKLAVTCAAIPFAQCAMAPGHNVASAAEPAAATAAVTTDADPALWVVKDDDTTIYLFGTVHVLKPGLSWFDEAVKQAFDKSDQLMLEIVLPEDQAAMAQKMIPLAIDQTGKTLSSRLSPDELKAYQAAMTSVGIPPAQFDMFEPWFAAMTLSIAPLAKLGYDPEQGAEKTLTAQAKAADKPVSGLETIEEQLGFFDGLPEKEQLVFLNATVKDIDQLGPTLDKMVVSWSKGDPEALAVLMNDSMEATPELAKTLLFDRNARWADTLKARMDQPGTVFVAVGAGHLAGKHSVQDYLKERGLTAERVKY